MNVAFIASPLGHQIKMLLSMHSRWIKPPPGGFERPGLSAPQLEQNLDGPEVSARTAALKGL